jgi:ribosomal protein S18 acetylase RimI-like enzyme
MPLQPSELRAYAAHVAARDGSEASEVLKRLQREVTEGEFCLSDVFVTLDPTGKRVSGTVRIVAFGQDLIVLTEWRGDEGACSYEAIAGLLAEVTARAAERGTKEMSTRVSLEGMTAEYRRALQDAGFVFQGRRVEYKTPLPELPDERPSRLAWRTMAEVGEEPVLLLIREASAETPDGMDVEAGVSVIEDVLGGSYDTLDPRAVQLGHLNGRPIGVLLTRVDPDSGWSAIQFMGVVPAFRGQGFGVDVHLHGIATMRALGGTLYHDGTSESNAAMVHLFEKHGCIEHSRMEEWHWTPDIRQ